jgi:tRNA A37 methylthiotransferase MiaB
MTEVRKGFNSVQDYARLVQRVHAHWIAVQAGIVFGFDNDTPEIFKETLDCLEQMGVQNATFNMLTPYPGTRLFQRLDAQRRILTRDWRKFNGRTDVVFQPKQMSVDGTPGGTSSRESAFLFSPPAWPNGSGGRPSSCGGLFR